jgi:hypothetical protein
MRHVPCYWEKIILINYKKEQMPKLSSMDRCSQQIYCFSTRTRLRSYSTQVMTSRYQICINDDRNLYLWKETWKEDTVADFLTRLSDSTIPRLDRQRIHLSFDGVRLGETTTMREVSAWPYWFPRYHQASLPASDSKLHHRPVWKTEMNSLFIMVHILVSFALVHV